MDTITLRSPREALVVIPHVLGFTPTHHIIVFGIESEPPASSGLPRNSGPLLRLTLDDRRFTARRGSALISAAVACGIKKAVVVAYCQDLQDHEGLEEGSEFRTFVDRVQAALTERWGGEAEVFSYLADPSGFCDGYGDSYPWSVLQGSVAAAAFVYEGSAPTDEEPEPSEEPADPARQRAAEMTAAGWRRALRATPKQAGAELVRRGDALLARAGAAEASPIGLGAAEAGALAVLLERIPARDALLMLALDPGPLDSLGARAPEGLPIADGERMPNVTRALAVLSLLDDCARHMATAPVLASAAYLAWAVGMNGGADARLARALEADPDYPLARLLATAVSHGVLPRWIDSGEAGMAGAAD